MKRSKRLLFEVAGRLDPVAHLRQELGAVVEDVVEDLGDRLLERRELDRRVAERQLEIRDLLRTQTRPCLLLGRHRLCDVVAPPDEIEERGRELERAGIRALAQERRHDGRRLVRRRLLLVLAVVARAALAAEQEPDDEHDGQRRHEARTRRA